MKIHATAHAHRTLLALVIVGCAALDRATALPQDPAAGQSGQKPAAAAERPLDFKDAIDESLRWLRFAQDMRDGGYGGSVETTAIVLRGMAECPRKYGRNDGPFVQRALDYLVVHQAPDGSIHDADADKAAVLTQTRAAAGALALHAHVSTEVPLKNALAFLSREKAAPEPWTDAPLPATREELTSRVRNLLGSRANDASWDGARGKVRETADNVVFLTRAWSVLKPVDRTGGAIAVKPLPAFEPADRDKALAAVTKGALWLAAGADHGKFGAPGKPNAGFTAMALGGLLSAPEPRAKPVQDAIDEGLTWLATLQRPDGSIQDGTLANYTTSAAILAFTHSGKAEYKPLVAKAQGYLIALQADEGEGYSPDHPYYGGNSYGDEQRPDLSNVQMALEALVASGLPKDHAAFQRALKFLERCQNRSESNDIKIEDGGKTIVSGDDGGSAYAPGVSKAGFIELADGRKVPISYGSMTYALLKGFIFAGLSKDDPRMKACVEWLHKRYTVDVNPGFERSADPTAAYQGLYYYLHTMAKALDLYGEATVVDEQGVAHNWRKDLAGRLVSMQGKSGSWVNENSERWYEGNPQLATAYALMTLALAAQ